MDRHVAVLPLMLPLVILAGCSKPPVVPPPEPGGGPASPAAQPTHKRLRFAVIPKQKDNPVFAYARQAAQKRADELSAELLWDAPTDNDEAKQAQIVETFAEQHVDGIAVSCSNPETLKLAIDKAVDAGIPVVTWDSDSPNSKRKAFYGINDFETGKLLGEELAALLPKGGKVAMLSGVQGAENLEQRLRGAKEALGKAPGIEVVSTVYCNDDVPKSVQLIGDLMSKYPRLDGLLMVGGWPLFASNGLNDVPAGKTKVVSVDPLPEAQKWIEDGHVQVCVGQKVFGWGENSVQMLFDLANHRPIANVDAKGFVDSGVDVVVKAKTGRYADAKYTTLAEYRTQFNAASGATP